MSAAEQRAMKASCKCAGGLAEETDVQRADIRQGLIGMEILVCRATTNSINRENKIEGDLNTFIFPPPGRWLLTV